MANAQICKWVVNDKLFCKTVVSKKKCVRRVDLHVLQNMASGNRLLSAFRFLSYPIKIMSSFTNIKYQKAKIKNMQ